MKFSLDTTAGSLNITGYGADGIIVNSERLTGSVLLNSTQLISEWHVESFETMTETDFQQVVALNPQLIILGTGDRQLFPPPWVYQKIAETGIGLEVMNTGAACRTFNVLVSEGRNVAAALLPILV